jgi:hypothetical protein
MNRPISLCRTPILTARRLSTFPIHPFSFIIYPSHTPLSPPAPSPPSAPDSGPVVSVPLKKQIPIRQIGVIMSTSKKVLIVGCFSVFVLVLYRDNPGKAAVAIGIVLWPLISKINFKK